MSKQPPAFDHPDSPNRRRLLQGLSVLLGSGAAAQLAGGNALSAALAWAPRENLAAPGQLFNAAQMASLRAICDLVIPRTDTPGAVDMDTHGFIDNQLLNVHSADDQARARDVLARLDEAAGAPFHEQDTGRQLALLEALDRGQSPFDGPDRAGFKFLKGLVLFGYFTSEAGASQALDFDPVPGGFTGSLPYADVGKAWGPGGLY
jgi:hypothetical protein